MIFPFIQIARENYSEEKSKISIVLLQLTKILCENIAFDIHYGTDSPSLFHAYLVQQSFFYRFVLFSNLTGSDANSAYRLFAPGRVSIVHMHYSHPGTNSTCLFIKGIHLESLFL